MPTPRRHLHVVDAGADHRAKPRCVHQHIERNAITNANAEHHEAEGREREAASRRGGRSSAGAGTVQGSPGPDHQAKVAMMNEKPSVTSTCPAHAGEAAQDQPLEQDADQADGKAGAEHRDPELPP